MTDYLLKARSAYEKYERYLTPAAFLIGFITDNLTLPHVELAAGNLVLLGYLGVAAIGIIIFNLYESKRVRHNLIEQISPLFPLLIQFAFGGLFSAYFVFYVRSASFSGSWPFLVALIFLLFGNELFGKYYQRLAFQVSVLFFSLFSFVVFTTPTVVHTMGPYVFLLSGAVSLFTIALFARLLGYIFPAKMDKSRGALSTSVVTIFAIMNLLYFTHAIPPLPLSLKEAGVYHRVTRLTDGNYQVLQEKSALPTFLNFFRNFHEIVHYTPGKPVYFYSAVFAPAELDAGIVHRWQRYDEKSGTWKTTDELSFTIFGGRDGGYRGYSAKRNLTSGKWRVDVLTSRGDLLGRMAFRVERAGETPVLEGKTL